MIGKIVKCNEPTLPPNYRRDNKSVFYNSSGEVNKEINFVSEFDKALADENNETMAFGKPLKDLNINAEIQNGMPLNDVVKLLLSNDKTFIGDTLNHDLEYIGAPGGDYAIAELGDFNINKKQDQSFYHISYDPASSSVITFKQDNLNTVEFLCHGAHDVVGEGPITKARIRRLLEKLNYTYMGKGLMKYSGNSKTDGVEGILSLHLSHKLIASIGILLKLNITFTKNYMIEVFDMAEYKLNNGVVLI